MIQTAPSGLYRQHASSSIRVDIDIDLAACHERKCLLAILGRALALPDWYGENFDALADCLSDTDWREGAVTLVRLSGLTHFSQQAPADYAVLLETLDTACRIRSEDGAPLAIILDDAPLTLPIWPPE